MASGKKEIIIHRQPCNSWKTNIMAHSVIEFFKVPFKSLIFFNFHSSYNRVLKLQINNEWVVPVEFRFIRCKIVFSEQSKETCHWMNEKLWKVS